LIKLLIFSYSLNFISQIFDSFYF